MQSTRLGACAFLVALGAALWAGQAHAFCREVNASPPVAYDPTDAGCFGASTGLPTLFWRNQCVSFSLQQGASKWVTLNDATNVATQAFATWTTAACTGGGSPSITPSLFPAVQCDSVPSQAHNNPIIFRDDAWPYGDSANAIGFTTLTVDLDNGEILGAAIEINSANFHIVANGPVPQGGFDLASILTHEAGHFLGLAHSGDPTAIMYAFYKAGSVTLTPDDIAGICTIYNPNGSRMTLNGPVSATTCNSQPIYGFLQQCGSLDSGALNSVASGPAASSVEGGANPCATDSSSCAVGWRARSPGAAAWALGLVGVGAVLRRGRRRGAVRSR